MQSRLVRSLVSIGLLVLVNLLWSTQFIAYKFVAKDMGPITVSFLMYVIATPLVLPFYLAERWHVVRPVRNAERSLWRWNNWIGFLVIGVLGAAPGSIFAAWGLSRTTASNGALLSLTIPVMTALLAAAILRERMTVLRWASLAVAIVGVLLLSIQAPQSAAKQALTINWQDLGLSNRDFVVGNLLVLVSCMSSSLYNVCSKSLLNRFSTVEVLTYSYFLVLVTDAVMLVAFEPLSIGVLATYSARTWTGLLLLGVVCSALGTVLWLYLLTRLDVGQAAVSVYLLPFFGVLLAAIFLHEQITLLMILGGVITLTGTILVVSTERAASESKKSPDSRT
jgi:drug/metabolite transporter (DMT)-like permease